MYIGIYVAVIVLFCATGLIVYAVLDKKNKKRKQILEEKAREENPAVVQDSLLPKVNLNGELQAEAEDERMEKFDINTSSNETQPEDNNFMQPQEMHEENYEVNTDVDARFKEYEEFLKRNLGKDVFVGDSGADNDFDSNKRMVAQAKKSAFDSPRLSTFDHRDEDDFEYDLDPKHTENEIEELLSHLPPKMQQIMLSDILARKKFDDDEN